MSLLQWVSLYSSFDRTSINNYNNNATVGNEVNQEDMYSSVVRTRLMVATNSSSLWPECLPDNVCQTT